MLSKSLLLSAQCSTVSLMLGMHFESLLSYFTALTILTFSELMLAQSSIFHVYFMQSILHICMLTEETKIFIDCLVQRKMNSSCKVALNQRVAVLH